MSVPLSEWDFSTTTVDEACSLTLHWQSNSDNDDDRPIPVRLQRRKSARSSALFCPRMDRMEPTAFVKVCEVAPPHSAHRVRVRQLRVVRGSSPALWRNGVCGCLLLAMLAILFSSLSSHASSQMSTALRVPLDESHALFALVRRHQVMGDSGAPFSVFWSRAQTDELDRLMSSAVASSVLRVRACDAADLANVHAWQLRLKNQNQNQAATTTTTTTQMTNAQEQLLVVIDDSCAPSCQDALTMWLDDSLPLVRGSARHMYYVLLAGNDAEKCTRASLAARLQHRIMNFVN
jgi:hypothetical protein